jgi:hypothetical protein
MKNMLFVIKTVSSSKSRKKNFESVRLRDISFLFSITLIYELSLIKISMNANIMKTQILNKIKYDLCH